ncbi:P-loop containing nucleoside triphosphate hydrolase [Pseudocohnilembus persalinus]|uniref:Kinesin-like protein n=1 Tax=Pseudocohnilembus persalinus TaxID=266149 RepID=A0A0V0QII3_PSEPJ|nr:P-loop containing nucleoside triphosphate hydrolase [Pseudocohnilembus persalinus]|eukprot:KRX02113.1 P-loop containing nucleoside triphosphate hydrolase [Pseudocohnilembus persalinus]
MIQEFDEPIRVIIRQRPPNQNDLKDENFTYAWNLTEENNQGNISINPKIQHQIKKTRPNFQKEPFNFDNVYDQNAKTEDIYEKEMKPIVQKAMKNSENGIIFLYGQTGAGKTFTMIGERDNESLKKEQSYLGTQYNTQIKNNKNNFNQQSQTTLSKTFKSFESEQKENNQNNISLNSLQREQQIDYQQSQGILTMCFKEIFEQINCIKQTSPFDHFSIYCSYLEIYNEKIYDLLKKYDNQEELQNLELRETEDKKFQAQGAEKEVVSTIDEIFQILEKGEINRHYAQTKMNLQSSRSHTIFKIEIKQQKAQQLQEKVSQLTFVDLAGSEKYNIHDDLSGSKRRIRQEEQKNICKSLFNLARVVSLISEQQEIQIKNQEIQGINNNQVKNQFSQNNLQKKSQKNPIYIPFRDSILTKILKEAFGGNCHCTFICCINPSQKEIDISYNTLQFAQRAKKIVNKLKKCQVYKKLSLQNLQDTYLAYQDKIKELENIMQLNIQDSGQKNSKNLKQSPDFLRNSSIYNGDYQKQTQRKIQDKQQVNSFSKNDKSTQKKKNESIFDQLIQNVSQEFTL